MDALDYEFLIRMVNDCGRDATKGADTDFYEKMKMKENNLQLKIVYDSDEERQSQYENAFSTVRRHVRKALVQGLDKIKSRADETEKIQLKSWTLLLDHGMYDRRKLDEIKVNAINIFLRYDLRSG